MSVYNGTTIDQVAEDVNFYENDEVYSTTYSNLSCSNNNNG